MFLWYPERFNWETKRLLNFVDEDEDAKIDAVQSQILKKEANIYYYMFVLRNAIQIDW